MASRVEQFEIPASSKTELLKFRSLKPDSAVAMFRGRQSKSGGGETRIALVDVQSSSIIDIGHSSPVNLLPPARPQ